MLLAGLCDVGIVCN